MRPAVLTSVSSRTPAEVSVQLVHTQRTRLGARVALTLVHLLGAVVSCESIRAYAVVFPRSWGTGAVVTRHKGAAIVKFIAVFAHVQHTFSGTDTSIIIHGVHTGGPVLARRRQAFF